MIQLQNYIMSYWKDILMNTLNYQAIKEKEWILNLNLQKYFLKDIIIMCGQKMNKNQLIGKN